MILEPLSCLIGARVREKRVLWQFKSLCLKKFLKSSFTQAQRAKVRMIFSILDFAEEGFGEVIKVVRFMLDMSVL